MPWERVVGAPNGEGAPVADEESPQEEPGDLLEAIGKLMDEDDAADAYAAG